MGDELCDSGVDGRVEVDELLGGEVCWSVLSLVGVSMWRTSMTDSYEVSDLNGGSLAHVVGGSDGQRVVAVCVWRAVPVS